MIYLLPILGAFLNRARGTCFWEHFSSTTVTRWAFAAGMGCIAGFIGQSFEAMLLTIFAMYLWCVFGWDNLWGQTITGKLSNRLQGLAKLAARMTLGAPCLIGLAYLSGHLEHAWVAALTPLLAVPYFISGYLTPVGPGGRVIANAELAVGAMWVIGYILVLGGWP